MTKTSMEPISTSGPTFDQISAAIKAWLGANNDFLCHFLAQEKENWLLINRDLNGRVRLVLPDHIQDGTERGRWGELAAKLMGRLGPHGHPDNTAILFETDLEHARHGASCYPMNGFTNAWMADRLATEANWTHITPETKGAARVVFSPLKAA